MMICGYTGTGFLQASCDGRGGVWVRDLESLVYLPSSKLTV